MQENFSGNTNVENELKNADLLMASGRWAEAEAALCVRGVGGKLVVVAVTGPLWRVCGPIFASRR